MRRVLVTAAPVTETDLSTPQHRASDVLPTDPAVPQGAAYAAYVKPVLDRVAAFILLVATLPILAAVAVAVYVELGRPIFFRQPRVGRGGRVFKVNKFRTMESDRRGERLDGFVGGDRRRTHKAANDPRIRSVGRFLRKWSLDELPQLTNVLAGDMSLVGPRPEMVSVVERYEGWQHARHQVKPGITGLWQVSAREVPMHEATHIDLEYVSRLSLRQDLRILAATLPAALGERKGF
jgi:lipopolysaccharide/colanic/teichoic acid biosynthesis glycosyltransferase